VIFPAFLRRLFLPECRSSLSACLSEILAMALLSTFSAQSADSREVDGSRSRHLGDQDVKAIRHSGANWEDCINRPDRRLHRPKPTPQFAPCNAGVTHTGRGGGIDSHLSLKADFA
jgi:hypothetical protein